MKDRPQERERVGALRRRALEKQALERQASGHRSALVPSDASKTDSWGAYLEEGRPPGRPPWLASLLTPYQRLLFGLDRYPGCPPLKPNGPKEKRGRPA